MKVYRLCRKEEVKKVLKDRNFNNIVHRNSSDSKQNTHKYTKGKEYMHFFEEEISLLYLNLTKGKIICIYDIPEYILEESKGKGFYLDFINFQNIQEVTEYAIESDKMRFEYLKQMYIINEDLDFDYMPKINELYDRMTKIYDSKILKHSHIYYNLNVWKRTLEISKRSEHSDEIHEKNKPLENINKDERE